MNTLSLFSGDSPNIGGPCPTNHYCEEGTSSPLPCPAGTYNNLTGQSVCFPCPEGYFCPENITTYENFPCPVGHYCKSGTRNNDQYPCPRGTFRNDTKGRSESDCMECTGGMYCGGEGLDAVTGSCAEGEFWLSQYNSWRSLIKSMSLAVEILSKTNVSVRCLILRLTWCKYNITGEYARMHCYCQNIYKWVKDWLLSSYLELETKIAFYLNRELIFPSMNWIEKFLGGLVTLSIIMIAVFCDITSW